MLSSLGSYFGGDSLVLAASHAQEVDDQSAPQLFNVVAELTLAAGLPMPRVYIINDPSPNAFATGRDPQHASVAITTGLLQKLDRERAPGRDRPRDVARAQLRHPLRAPRGRAGRRHRADRRLLPALHVLRRSVGAADADNNPAGGGGAQTIIFIIAIVLAILAPDLRRLVQMAVSRQREYLADASSVDLTRNPLGLESALDKIAADPELARRWPTGPPSTSTS